MCREQSSLPHFDRHTACCDVARMRVKVSIISTHASRWCSVDPDDTVATIKARVRFPGDAMQLLGNKSRQSSVGAASLVQ
jgi:hypothetical protein